jgi:hypothetical protein
MMHFYRPFLFFHTLALVVIVAQGRVREADALKNCRPKVLQPGRSSASWPEKRKNENMAFQRPYRKAVNRIRPPLHFNARQQEQPGESTKMNMALGPIGMPEFQRRTLLSVPSTARRLVFVTTLAVALMKPRSLASIIQSPAWFLVNVLYKPYQNSLVTNPLVTKVITGAVLAIAGDAVAQATSNSQAVANGETKASYDKRRALSFAVFDSCYRVFQHNMFPFIIRSCQGNIIKRLLPMLEPAAAAIEQTAVYQFCVVPGFYYPIFFAFTGVIQGLNARQSLDRMKANFFPCWKRNLMFWIPTQMVLFGLVAEKWQIPFACLMGMLWSTILSKTAGNTKK